jgi:hypothetical protein
MKARFVRGQDPKDAMGIGKGRKIKAGDRLEVFFIFMSGNKEYEFHRDKMFDAIADQDEKDPPSGRELTVRIISDDEILGDGTWISYWHDELKEWVIE